MAKKTKKFSKVVRGMKRKKVTAAAIKESQRAVRLANQWLICSKCQSEEIEVTGDVSRVTCGHCVQMMVPPPFIPSVLKKKTGFPRGWHFKARFVSPDGDVYERGKLVGRSEPGEQPTGGKRPTATRKKRKSAGKKSVKKRSTKKGKRRA